MACDYCDSIYAMTGRRHCPIHSETPPPIAAESDPEYQTRIEAERVTAEFRVSITPQAPQRAIEDLPLFGGERQGELFS